MLYSQRKHLFFYSFLLLIIISALPPFLISSNTAHAESPPVVNLFIGEPDNLTESGAVTNKSFGVVVSEAGYVYIRFPNGQKELKYVIDYLRFNYVQNGTYTIYCFSPLSNPENVVNMDMTITLDNTPPTISLYSEDNMVPNESHVNGSVSAATNDELSQVAEFAVSKSGNDFVPYNDGILTVDGVYIFRASDVVGNVSTATITKDSVKPVLNVYSDNEELISGSLTNSKQIRVEAIDDLSGVQSIYVKLPNNDFFTEYSQSEMTFTAAGQYEMYASDKAGNCTNTFTVTMDNIIPNVTIKENGTVLPNGSHTNADAISFYIDKAAAGYVTRASTNNTSEITNGTVFTAEDTYIFYAVDNAQNKSEEITVTIDRTSPTSKLYADDIATSDKFVSCCSLRYVAEDVHDFTVYSKTPNENLFQETLNSSAFTEEGLYSFYALDKAGNRSKTTEVVLDRTPPSGFVTIDDARAESGVYTNKAVTYQAVDNGSGILRLEIYINQEWVLYEGNAIIPPETTELRFRAIDNAHNLSEESVVFFSSAAPRIEINSDAGAIESDYTNSKYIEIRACHQYPKYLYVKQPSSDTFIKVPSGSQFAEAGKYEIYAEDMCQNVSPVRTVIIDRTAKTVTALNITDGVARQDVRLTWQDTQNLAPIASVTVNGIVVSNGQTIQTIDGGKYEILCVDTAGNESVIKFRCERRDIETATCNKEWWENKDSSKTYAFDSYNKALAFGKAYENSLVTTHIWNGDIWDTGYPMDAVDAQNAKQGTFYVYKSCSDSSLLTAYFTAERLNEVISHYAAENIKHYYFWEKVPAQADADSDLFTAMTKGNIITDKLQIRSDLNYYVDGIPQTNSLYSTGGQHTLIIKDEFGNSYSYLLIIVTLPPNLSFRVNQGDYHTANQHQDNCFTTRVTVKILNDYDSYAMALVVNAAGATLKTLNLNEEFIITEAGKYIVRTVNHGGTQDYAFYISYTPPSFSVESDEQSKRFVLCVTPSPDSTPITNLHVERKIQGEWIKLETDDYGALIDKNKMTYSFFRSGFYRFIVEDLCRIGINKVVREFKYSKPAPSGILQGINEHGYSNRFVSFVWTDEAYVILKKDDVSMDYISGIELTDDGDYELLLCDYDGYEQLYTFVIKTSPPEIQTEGEIRNGYAKEPIRLSVQENTASIKVTLNGSPIPYLSGDELTDNGRYVIEATDLAGNVSALSFTLDTAFPECALNGVTDGGSTKSAVVISNINEEADIIVYFNGKETPYTLGEELKAVGTYRVVLTDKAGNVSEYTFTVAYSVNAAGVAVIVIAAIAIAATACTVMVFRKKAKKNIKRTTEDK